MKCMKQIYSIALLLLLLLSVSTGVSAQIKGVITDSLTHEPLSTSPYNMKEKVWEASPMQRENTR